MDLIQPIIGAIDAWLAIWNYLPFPVTALASVAIFFLFLSKVIRISFGSKGD